MTISIPAATHDVTRHATLFDPVEAAIDAIGRGEIVVVADDEDRENEGDLIMAAELVTEEQLAFFVRHTSGVICVGLTGDRCDDLQLPLMMPPAGNTESMGTAFTVTLDLADGTTTGISAADRARTLRASPIRRLARRASTARATSSRCEPARVAR